MDINSICPRKEWLREFRECWPNIQLLENWHRKFTPWINEETLNTYLNYYKEQIQKNGGEMTQRVQQSFEDFEIEEKTTTK